MDTVSTWLRRLTQVVTYDSFSGVQRGPTYISTLLIATSCRSYILTIRVRVGLDRHLSVVGSVSFRNIVSSGSWRNIYISTYVPSEVVYRQARLCSKFVQSQILEAR